MSALAAVQSPALVTSSTSPYDVVDARTHGIDPAVVVQAFRGLTLSESGMADTLTSLYETPTRRTLSFAWRERRFDGRNGRMLKVSALTSLVGTYATTVSIGSCYSNASTRRRGLARQTRDFAAQISVPFGAPITICAAKKDGPAAWLVLEGQPDQDELDRAIRTLSQKDAPKHVIADARARDFVGMRARSRTDFAVFVKAIGAWDGGWTAEQAKAYAAAATAAKAPANEGMR